MEIIATQQQEYVQTASFPALQELKNCKAEMAAKLPEMMKVAATDLEDTASISDMARAYLEMERQVANIEMIDKLAW